MIIIGIKRSNKNITLYTEKEIISFNIYESDTPQKILDELIEEGFKIVNLEYLKKILKIVLYTRFTSIINKL